MSALPNSCKVVVIGGGVTGTSCAYHIAKFGWNDVILLERDQTKAIPPLHGALLKNEQDVQMLERLRFMLRREN